MILQKFLRQKSDIYEKIIELRPNGPLEISYMRGAAEVVPCRYDFILADTLVEKVEYLYQESVASEDHSLVRTTFL